jgi:transposase-like protein
MAKPKSNRERAVELFEKGSTQAELARQLEVSRVTAMKWQRIWQDSGRDGSDPRSTRKKATAHRNGDGADSKGASSDSTGLRRAR